MDGRVNKSNVFRNGAGVFQKQFRAGRREPVAGRRGGQIKGAGLKR